MTEPAPESSGLDGEPQRSALPESTEPPVQRELLAPPDPDGAPEPLVYVEVALSLPLQMQFTYRLPPGMQASPGHRLRVPFRGRAMTGIVIRVRTDPGDLDPAKIREIIHGLDQDLVLPDSLLKLAEVMAQSYGCSLGQALDAMLPAVAKKRGAKMVPHLELVLEHQAARELVLELEDKFQAQSRVLRTVLEFGAPLPVVHVRRRTDTSDSPWKTLVKRGALRRVMVQEELQDLVPAAEEAAVRHDLNEDQARAVNQVTECVVAGRHETFLLHGVTGAGKTEVYLRILEAVREQGKTAIVLVPEIALTPQTVGRFASRFPDVAVLHSGLTDADRGKQWRRLAEGKASIAIGARSALFAPLHNLGLIVLDEEHEPTFKQESTPRYHARAMAIERGRIEGGVVVLGSATPTLESYGKARRGVYSLLELPSRAGAGQMPKIIVEDLRVEGKESRTEGVVLSRTLRVLIEERLKARDQVILFLNRRGWAPSLMCPSCGTPVQCDHCALSMTWHSRRGRLVCHMCSEERRRPEQCSTCEHAPFHELGMGTERVERAIKGLFPEAVVARMDADTMSERGAHERVLRAFRKREIDLLIGTQMIAKGLDFPDVTLVGVVDADTGLYMADYRAAERTFQLLYQVAGRAGRAEKPGTVVIQTHCPENIAIESAAKIDYEGFVKAELSARKMCGYPPFSRLVRLLAESPREWEATKCVRTAVDAVRGTPDLATLGPSAAPMVKVKDRFRHHVMVKCFTDAAFETAMAAWKPLDLSGTRTLRVTLDVDPASTL